MFTSSSRPLNVCVGSHLSDLPPSASAVLIWSPIALSMLLCSIKSELYLPYLWSVYTVTANCKLIYPRLFWQVYSVNAVIRYSLLKEDLSCWTGGINVVNQSELDIKDCSVNAANSPQQGHQFTLAIHTWLTLTRAHLTACIHGQQDTNSHFTLSTSPTHGFMNQERSSAVSAHQCLNLEEQWPINWVTLYIYCLVWSGFQRRE